MGGRSHEFCPRARADETEYARTLMRTGAACGRVLDGSGEIPTDGLAGRAAVRTANLTRVQRHGMNAHQDLIVSRFRQRDRRHGDRSLLVAGRPDRFHTSAFSSK